jgi:hypothetical protein
MLFAIDSLNANHFQILDHNFYLLELYAAVLWYNRYPELSSETLTRERAMVNWTERAVLETMEFSLVCIQR